MRSHWMRISRALAWALIVLVHQMACAEWPYQVTKGPFHVHADFSLDQAHGLFLDLESLPEDVQRALRLLPSVEPVDVYLFAQETTYRQYMRYYFPGVAPRPAMFIKTNSPGNVFAHLSREFATDVRHECTHAVLHTSLPMVPLWLDEGIAEYFEVPAQQRAFRQEYVKSIRRHLKLWRRPPALERLEKMQSISEMGSREYREAWSWVHFMLHGPDSARRVLLAYFAELQQHSVPPPLSHTLSANIDRLNERYVAHFTSRR